MAYTTIDDPSAYFQTVLYTGNATNSTAITNTGNSDLQPDWLWIKNRSSSGGVGPHFIVDSSRGANKDFHMNNDEAEHTTTNAVKSFNSDGFTIDDGGTVNNNTDNYVAWQWKCNGGTTSSNTDGSVTTTIQVNQTLGFSIVLWTANGTTSGTIGHGLGATPTVIIEKYRSATSDWSYFTNTGGNKLLFLNKTDAATTSFSGINSVGSSTFTDGNSGTETRIAYCFTPIQGYSKYGIYEGNNNSNGPFIYLGFEPALFIVKNVDSTAAWRLYSNKISNQNGFNDLDRVFYPNTNEAESGTGHAVDFLSNGIKIRGDNEDVNDADTYTYMAFAEHPFVSSEGVPCTAR